MLDNADLAAVQREEGGKSATKFGKNLEAG